MMSKKDTWEKSAGKTKQMNAFMETQRKRLDLNAENQERRLEMESEKQARMLEIEATNAKTKAKEVTLASMMTGVEIMKVDLSTVDLSTVTLRKRPWFEKMQTDMLKFNND
ncbi:Protein UXT-like protein [Hordeum vulgare]|nr:Protein UXT-like protein [Hordeum vulgare]